MTKKFCMYVNTPGPFGSGYWTYDAKVIADNASLPTVGGTVQTDRARALVYDSVEAVNAAIAKHGWVNSTSVKPCLSG